MPLMALQVIRFSFAINLSGHTAPNVLRVSYHLKMFGIHTAGYATQVVDLVTIGDERSDNEPMRVITTST